MAYGNTVFGMNQITIVGASGTPVALDAAMELEVTEETETKTLEGNDKTVDSRTFMKAIQWKIKGGGLTAAAYAALTGRAATVSGTAPNQKTTVQLKGGDNYPEVKIYGKALGGKTDDLHMLIYRAVAQKVSPIQLKTGNFSEFAAEGIGLPRTSDSVAAEIVQNETTAALPAS
jgi:hypothetical protein